MDKDIYGYKCKTLAAYGATAYVGYSALKYAYSSYQYAQTRAKGKKLRDLKLDKKYTFENVENEDDIV